MTLVIASYDDSAQANRAVEELVEAEFEANEISIVVADEAGGHEVAVDHDTGVAEGAVAGAAGLVGALAGLGFWKEEADLHAEDLRQGAV